MPSLRIQYFVTQISHNSFRIFGVKIKSQNLRLYSIKFLILGYRFCWSQFITLFVSFERFANDYNFYSRNIRKSKRETNRFRFGTGALILLWSDPLRLAKSFWRLFVHVKQERSSYAYYFTMIFFHYDFFEMVLIEI